MELCAVIAYRPSTMKTVTAACKFRYACRPGALFSLRVYLNQACPFPRKLTARNTSSEFIHDRVILDDNGWEFGRHVPWLFPPP